MRSRLFRQLLPRDHPHPAAPTAPTSTSVTIRPFTYNAGSLSSRPQLPFLSIPSRSSTRHNSASRQQWRYLSTKRVKYEVGLALKWTAYFWAIILFLTIASFAITQDVFEARFPTPHEWSMVSRWLKRSAEAELARTDVIMENWVAIIQIITKALARLEDPTIDGKGLQDVKDGPPGAKDISAMPEPWRRGYFETLLLCCKAAEHVEGWVVDTTRKMAFAPDVVKGPSHPFPKPVGRGGEPAPHEANCVPAGFPYPADLYVKLLATVGLTSKQRMDATLAYATWLENKGALAPAAVMYEDALNVAIEEIYTPGAPFLLDPKTAVLNSKAERKPSENLLVSLTALATFKARHEEVAEALPILISILQARRSLPAPQVNAPTPEGFSLDPSSTTTTTTKTTSTGPLDKVLSFLAPPAYPPPSPDGTAPPLRDSKELCEEAALHIYIGEIMYTMQASTKEDGLAWTREGVDLAEEELHKVLDRSGASNSTTTTPADRDRTKQVCRECLASGLENWQTMVQRMARAENEARNTKAAQPSSSSAGWFGGLWSGSRIEEDGGRWVAEEKVVDDRTKRAQELLDELQPPRSSFWRGLVRA